MTEKYLYAWWQLIQNLVPALKLIGVPVPFAISKQQHFSDIG